MKLKEIYFIREIGFHAGQALAKRNHINLLNTLKDSDRFFLNPIARHILIPKGVMIRSDQRRVFEMLFYHDYRFFTVND